MKRALAILLSLLLSSPLLAASPEVRQVIRLRDAGQFEAAEKEAHRRLSQPSLSEDARLDLTLELSRTWAEHALASSAEKQTERWSQAQQVINDFTSRYPRHPKLLLVRAQGALADLSRAQQAREDAELAGEDPSALKAVRELLRAAIVRLSKLHDDVEKQLHTVARDDRRTGTLTPDELQSLGLNVRRHWARALREQALSYGPTSADRINSLSRALEVLKPLGTLEPNTSFAWTARLDEIGCLRMIEDTTAAEHRLQALARAVPPAELQGRLRAERTRVALARGQLDEALAEAAPGAPRGPSDWTEADLALLETYLALWNQAEQSRQPARGVEWEQGAADQTATIVREHGVRAGRQADLLLARHLAGRELALLPVTQLRVAEGLERGGKPVEALAAYALASQSAGARGLAELAFSAELSAAQLEQGQQHFAEAAKRFRALAMSARQHPRAAEAHLLAVHCAAQEARQQQLPQLDQYEQLLDEHLATWPDAATASQARSWLGRLHEQRGEYAKAIDVLSRVKNDAPPFGEAVKAMGRCYESWLAELRQQGRPTTDLATKAVAHFEAIAAPGGKLTRDWTPLKRAAVVAEARILLRQSPRDARRAEELVSAALNGAPPPGPEVEHELQALRVATLAASDRLPQAKQEWERLPLTDVPAQWLVEALGEMRRAAAGDRQTTIARLELTIVDDLLGGEAKAPDDAQLNLRRRRVELLVVDDRRREAVAEMTALASEHPADGQTQEELAQLLASGDRASIAQASAKWREVASKCRPGSPRWWRAHYGLARAQLDLGQMNECWATLKTLEKTPGDFGGPEMKARFVQLKRECGQASSGTPRTTK